MIATEERQTAKNIAEMQLEYIKSLDFDESYTPMRFNRIYRLFSGYTEGKIYPQIYLIVTTQNSKNNNYHPAG